MKAPSRACCTGKAATWAAFFDIYNYKLAELSVATSIKIELKIYTRT